MYRAMGAKLYRPGFDSTSGKTAGQLRRPHARAVMPGNTATPSDIVIAVIFRTTSHKGEGPVARP
jgi:hypothetical protein